MCDFTIFTGLSRKITNSIHYRLNPHDLTFSQLLGTLSASLDLPSWVSIELFFQVSSISSQSPYTRTSNKNFILLNAHSIVNYLIYSIKSNLVGSFIIKAPPLSSHQSGRALNGPCAALDKNNWIQDKNN